MIPVRAVLGALMLGLAAPCAEAQVLGEDAACQPGHGPAIRVEILGLKDRTGRLKLELYPPNAADFLEHDTDLVRQGKVFRRVWADTPATGDPVLCIRVPAPGRYAILFTHDRDGRNKFNFWRDGAGFPANLKLGRSRPRVEQALVAVGTGVTGITVRAQYLRGLSGFAPIAPD